MAETLQYTLRVRTEADTAPIRRVKKDLDQVEKTTQRTHGTMRGLGKGGKDASLGILELSYAIEDAQYGLRGLQNNIPRLLMSLGGSAGLAGVASIVAVTLGLVATRLTAAQQKIEETNDTLAETRTKFAADAADKRNEEIDLELELANLRAESFSAQAQAEQKSATDRAGWQAKLIEAQAVLNELLGQALPIQERIAASAQAEANARRASADAEIAKQQAAIVAAQENVAKAQRTAEARRQRAAELAAAEAANEQSILETVERRAAIEAELVRIRQIGKGAIGLAGPGAGTATLSAGQRAEREMIPDLEAQLKTLDLILQSRTAGKSDLASSSATAGRAATRSAAQLENVERDAADAIAAAQTAIAAVRDSLGANDAIATVQTAAQQGQETATALKQVIDSLSGDTTGLTSIQLASLASLRQIVADNRITGDEIARAYTDLSTLSSALRGDLTKLGITIAEMLRSLRQEINAAKNKIAQAGI